MLSIKLWLSVLILSLLTATCFASAQTDFKQGVKHFKNKQYTMAITFFQRARKQGLKTPALYHNLAVSHFKLSQFKRAEKYFKISQRDPKMKTLAEYNLGLIALNRKQQKTALSYFERVAAQTSNKKLAAKANSRIRKITKQKKTNGFASGQFGYGTVDNISAAPEVGTSTKRSDNFYRLFIIGELALTGTLTNGISVGGIFLSKDYDVENAYDFQIYGININKTFTQRRWKSRVGFYRFESSFGSSDFQTTNRLSLGSKYALSRQNSVQLRYRYDDITSNNTSYDYLAGSRQQIRTEYRYITKTDYLKLYYEFEQNDRQNTATQSYSPQRHTLRSKYTYKLTDKLSLMGDLTYRISTYPAKSTTLERDDKRINTSIDLSYRVNKTFKIRIKHTNTNNRSSDAVHTFQRNTTALYLEAII